MGKRAISAKVNELVERVKHGDDEAFAELAEIFGPMIKRIASKVSISLPPGVTFDDLISWGLHGLWEAALKYKLGREAEFSTFAYWRIKGEMLDAIRQMTTVGRQLWDNWKKVASAIQELERELNREPTVEEISKKTGMSVGKIKRLMNLVNFLVVDDVGAKSERRMGQIESDIPTPQEEILKKERQQRVREALETLTERQKLVIQLYYWENMTISEIAKVLELSPARVSQLHSQALLKLRSYLTSKYKEDGLIG